MISQLKYYNIKNKNFQYIKNKLNEIKPNVIIHLGSKNPSFNKSFNKKDLNKFINFLVNSLDQVGFLQPDHKRKSMIQNIRTIFHKMNLSDKEMRILLGIFSSLKEQKVH